MCQVYVNISQWHYFVTSEGSLTNELTSHHQRYSKQCFNLLRIYSGSLHKARGQTHGVKGRVAVLRGTVAGLLSPTARLQPVPGCCSPLWDLWENVLEEHHSTNGFLPLAACGHTSA